MTITLLKLLEPAFETSVIKDFDPYSSDCHDPSGCEVKESEAKSDDYVSNRTEMLISNHHSFVVDFDKKNI